MRTACLALLSFAACSNGETSDEGTRRGLYLGEDRIGAVQERVSEGRIERSTTLDGLGIDTLDTRWWVDDAGFVTRATYRRRGRSGARSVSLAERTLRDDATGRTQPIEGDDRLVVLEIAHHLRPPPGKTAVVIVDLATGGQTPGHVAQNGDGVLVTGPGGVRLAEVEARGGGRSGPGLFAEQAAGAGKAHLRPAAPATDSAHRVLCLKAIDVGGMRLDGPGQRRIRPDCVVMDPDHRPAVDGPSDIEGLFLQHDDARVESFARPHRGKTPTATAVALAEAVHDLLQPGGGGPPSALDTLARRTGDCDDATALLVASLRSLGLVAKPVVGFRQVGEEYVAHAWAEVAVDGTWMAVDATLPGAGAFPSHLKLFDGLGHPWDMGRVLGRVRIEAQPPGDAARTTP